MVNSSVRVALRDSRGKFSTARKAKYFYIYYGRTLVFKGVFPRINERIASKEDRILDAISYIEGELEKQAPKKKTKRKIKKKPTAKKGTKKKKEPEISVKLFDSRGRPAAPSRAKIFKIFYGRKLYYTGKFPRVSASIGAKETYILNTLNDIESQTAFQAPPKKKKPKKIRKKARLIEEEIKPLSDKEKLLYDIIEQEYPSKPDKYETDPAFHGVLDDSKVVHIPIVTASPDYEKEYVYKQVYSQNFERCFLLKILDFQLTSDNLIKVTPNNKQAVKERLEKLFLPHFKDFYEKHKDALYFQGRLTFDWFTPDGEAQSRGVGTTRSGMIRNLWEFLQLNYYPLVGERFLAAPNFRSNYVAASLNNEVLITGFTIEAVIEEWN
jgi:hypothetical protein